MSQFGPVLTAMVTPFDDAGALDLDKAQELAAWLIGNGNQGLVLAGTTGESPTLTHGEQIDLIRAVVEAVPDTAHILAGAGSNDTSAAVELTKQATKAGATGILSVAPYYNRPPQSGLYRHFATVAAATDLPVMLYDIPVRTGRKVETETLIQLAEIENVTSLKDAAGSPPETAKLLAATGDDFEVYSGDDSYTLALLAVGAVGVVGVASHWAGVEMAAMIEAYHSGDVAKAAAINRTLLSSYDFESLPHAPNPMPTKALLRAMGRPVGSCRPPMMPETEDLQQLALALLAELGKGN